MASSGYNLVVPFAGWLVAVSSVFVGYLAVLEIKQIRHNRHLNRQRARLGLRPA